MPTHTSQPSMECDDRDACPGNDEKCGAVISFESADIRTLLSKQNKERYYYKLSSREMESLSALCDTFLPSLDVPNDAFGMVDDSTAKFFGTSAAGTRTPERVAKLISEMIWCYRYPLRVCLILLSSWMGTLMLCGLSSTSMSFPFFHKFSKLSLKKRQQIALSWSLSWFHTLTKLFLATKSLILMSFFTEVDDNNENPSWKAIGYCGPDPDFKTKTDPKPTKLFSNGQEQNILGPLHKGLVNMSNPKETILKTLRSSGFQASVHRRSPSSPRTTSNPSMTIRCDAVVVGSGSGGGVVAGTLASAGYKVLVLEKGTYIARSNLSLLEGQSLNQMYEAGGVIPTKDLGVLVLAGSTVGGGSAINWSASIKTPSHVVREWSEDHGLEIFDSDMYREALDHVCEKMEVQSETAVEGLNNEVLRRGCKELGYPIHDIPRNAPRDHYCGWCFMGCKDGRKKGTSETWLKDLVESGNGLILPECEVTRVVWSKGGRGGRGRARGVAFEFGHEGAKEVCVVEVKVTVVASGALNTPVLLRKSGLRNGNIGRNLHLHPVAMAWGVFPERGEKGCLEEDGGQWRPETGKKSYEGAIMTAMSPVVANFETSGYGALIQTPSLHPGLFSALMPWTSGYDIKKRMTKFCRTAHFIALTRDVGSGEIISQDPRNIRYQPAAVDETNLKKGLEKMLRIMAAAGAEEIGTHHRSGPTINVKKASCREFEQFLDHVGSMGVHHRTSLASAHQMGSCRMGTGPTESVVDQRGETWEVEGLFLADTSVFPTALGVNPMVTVMAISYCTAQAVLEVLRRKRTSR